MRLMEDAAAAPAWHPPRKRTIAMSLLAGMVVGIVCALTIAPPHGARFEARLAWDHQLPADRDWPHVPLEGESARLEGDARARTLVVTSHSAASARALLRAFSARHAPAAEDLAARLAPLRETWRVAAPAVAMARVTGTTECAALLLARARWGEELAQELPLAIPSGAARAPKSDTAVTEAWTNVEWAAEDRDPIRLRLALDETARVDREWFGNRSKWEGWTVPQRAQAWRDWQHSRVQLLEPIASRLMAWEGGAQRIALESAAKAALVQLDARAGDPWASFAVTSEAPVRPLVRPMLLSLIHI